MMHGREKSDPAVVAMKPAKSAAQAEGELVERRAGAKGKAGQGHVPDTAPATRVFPICSVCGTRTLCRHHPRWEPGALIGHAGFCAGGAR